MYYKIHITILLPYRVTVVLCYLRMLGIWKGVHLPISAPIYRIVSQVHIGVGRTEGGELVH